MFGFPIVHVGLKNPIYTWKQHHDYNTNLFFQVLEVGSHKLYTKDSHRQDQRSATLMPCQKKRLWIWVERLVIFFFFALLRRVLLKSINRYLVLTVLFDLRTSRLTKGLLVWPKGCTLEFLSGLSDSLWFLWIWTLGIHALRTFQNIYLKNNISFVTTRKNWPWFSWCY